MSDQNRFDQYKQKLLQIWGLILAACGRFWDKTKVYARKAVELLRKYAAILARKLAVFSKAAGAWLKKAGSALRRLGKRILQVLAACLLLAREKTAPVAAKVKSGIGSVRARFPKRTAPVEDRALPDGCDSGAEDPVAPEPVEEPEQPPVRKTPRKLPAWLSKPWMVKTLEVLGIIGMGVGFVFKWICKLYRLILAVPVLWYAIKFAKQNMDRLPEEVGLDIQATGEFARMISRQEAVYWPLGITVFCLVLMICSKKPILPWIISIFTLVLPWLIWLLNYYA